MITSLQNTKIKHISALLQKQKLRNEEKLFIVEGRKMMEECPIDRILEVYITESFYKDQRSFVERFQGKPLEIVTENVFKQMSDVMTPPRYFGYREAKYEYL